MDPTTVASIAILMMVAAALYSSVGHGGASAYLAIMALFSVAPEVMRPTALSLNLLVAGLAALRYWRSGQINLRLAAYSLVAAAPSAYLAGSLKLAPEIYRPLVGAMLLAAAVRLFWQPEQLASRPVKPPRPSVLVPVGAGLGFLAGLTGTGGGIFLSPLIILMGWEDAKRTSGVVALFIFVNSAAGLAGNLNSLAELPPGTPVLAGAVLLGAVLGTWLGTRKLDRTRLLQGLGIVLVIAGAKLVLT